MAGIDDSIRLFQGNTDPSITDTITNAAGVVDLTGAVVTFNMRLANSSATTVSANATIVNPTAGTVRYDWATNDLQTVGNYRAWWHVHFASAKDQDSPEFSIKVLPHTALDTDLCTIFDVREAMGLPSIASGSDDQIQEYISEASEVITDLCKRQFTSEGTDTKIFQVKNFRVDFYPYDLATLTQVVLRPESGGGEVLDITSLSSIGGSALGLDVNMSPFDKRWGVWTSMKISPMKVVTTPYSIRFGHPLVAVTGNWGMPSIPTPVKRAAVICVRSWMRRDGTAFANARGQADVGTAPQPQGTYDIPFAAQKLLKRVMRWPGVL